VNSAARIALACMACLLALALSPAAAGATVTIESFTTSASTAQAGMHPDLGFSFSLGESGDPEPVESADLHLPGGFFISQIGAVRCTAEDFANFECWLGSQVGLVTIRADYDGDPSHLLGTAPVYSLVPGSKETARFGFVIPFVAVPVEIPVTVRDGSDYGTNLTIQGLPQETPLTKAKLTLWGVPASTNHNTQRFAPGSPGNPPSCPTEACSFPSRPTGTIPLPLLWNPRTCSVPLSATLGVHPYLHPSDVVTSTAAMPTTTGCNQSPFDPSFHLGLTSEETSTPTGLDLTLSQPSWNSVNIPAPADIRAVTLELPAGLKLDSEAADALSTCSESQFGLGLETAAACPPGSEVGAFSIKVVDYEDPLEGAAYFGAPEPGGAYRLFLVASGASLEIKLVGLIEPSPGGEHVTIAISDLPQFPLRELQIEIAASHGLFVTPVRCGTYSATGNFTPWGPAQKVVDVEELMLSSVGPDEGPCPGPATDVDVSLSPFSIVADGSSTSIATATVSDADEIGVFADDVTFSSSDPAAQIGAVNDNGDGTYTAQITSSTTVGASTITVTDTSVDPEVLGTATLTQLAPPTPTPPISTPPAIPPVSPPVVTITAKPGRQTHDRTPTFRFVSDKPGPTFRCKVDDRPSYRCSSPATLARLGLGAHIFRVSATDAAGYSSAPAKWGFSVRRRL